MLYSWTKKKGFELARLRAEAQVFIDSALFVLQNHTSTALHGVRFDLIVQVRATQKLRNL